MNPIDLTDRYIDYAHPDTDWHIPIPRPPVEAIAIHHTVGFYGSPLTDVSTQDEEVERIDDLAADHFERFGIGPGYWYVACPSGRSYAVGKHGTHRAHAKGRSPETLERWNVVGRAVAAFGNLQDAPPNPELVEAVKDCTDDLRSYIENPDVPAIGHTDLPSVNRFGVAYDQTTECPGGYMLTQIATGRFGRPSDASIDLDAARALNTRIERDLASAANILQATRDNAAELRRILEGHNA